MFSLACWRPSSLSDSLPQVTETDDLGTKLQVSLKIVGHIRDDVSSQLIIIRKKGLVDILMQKRYIWYL